MSDCRENCIMEERIRQLEEKAKHNSEEHSKFYDNFQKSNLLNHENTIKIQNIFEKLDQISGDVKEIKEKPLKAADKFNSAVISAVGSAVGVAFIGIVAYVITNGMP